MGKPAARIGDMHTCPMVTPGTPPVPHVGGPVLPPGAPTVLVGGMPAAVLGDMCTCVGPPDSIVMGSTGVFIGGKPAARLGDPTVHGGVITVGCPTVLIGESSPGGPNSPISPVTPALADMDAETQAALKDLDPALLAAIANANPPAGGGNLPCTNQSIALHEAITKKFGADSAMAKKLHEMVNKYVGHPVDVASGNFFTKQEDFNIPGVIPLTWERRYHSDSKYDGPLGFGWHHSYDWTLQLAETERLAIVRMGDGRVAMFDNIPLSSFDKWRFNRSEKLFLGKHADGHYFVRSRENLEYNFSATPLRGKERLLTSICNFNGFALRFIYDGKGCLNEIIDTAGRHFLIESNRKGRITSIQAPHPDLENAMFAIAAFEYDGDGNLSRQINAIGNDYRFEYSRHLLVKETWRNGFNWYFVYDGKNTGARCVETWGDGDMLHYRLTYLEGETRVVNSLGYTNIYYHHKGLVTKKVDARGNEWGSGYNEYNELLWESDPKGNIQHYTYDDRGNLRSSTDPAGGSIQIRYLESGFYGLPEEAADANGGKWKWEYDTQANLIKRIDPSGAETRFEYTGGQLAAILNAAGHSTKLFYSPGHQLNKAVTPDGGTMHWGYDRLGRLKSLADVKGNERKFTIDLLGRVTTFFEPDGNIRNFFFDAEDNVVRVKDNLQEIQFTYSGLGKVTSRAENRTTVQFTYDTEDQLTGIINEHGLGYYFTLDPNGDVVTERGFDGLTRQYQRDAAGMLTKVVRPGGKETSFDYNPSGKVEKVVYSEGTEEVYTYNSAGDLMEAGNEITLVRFDRDIFGRVIKETCGEHSVQTSYDILGNRVKVSSSLGADIHHAFNNMGDQESLEAGTWQTRFTRDELGYELDRSLPGGIRSSWERDKMGRPLKHNIFAGTGQTGRHRAYRWDVNDRLKEIVDSVGGSRRFTHDAFGNLAQTSYENGMEELRLPDAVGNLFKTADRNDRKYGPAGQLLEANGTRYTYDAEGNLAEKAELNGKHWFYTWNAAGMLQSVTRPDGILVSFTYDALGRRLSKTYHNTVTRWVWDGNTPLHEWKEDLQTGQVLSDTTIDKDGVITWVFEADSFVPAAKLRKEKSYAIITDHIGTPFSMFDEKGAKTWEAEYDSYGKITSYNSDSRVQCPFRYQGQYEDVETGLYYNRFRYYDPEDGVYISSDPISLNGGFALYSYVDDPNIFADIFGLKKKSCYPSQKGPQHHIATNKHHSKWTPIFKKYFDNAGLDIDKSPENLVDVINHKGPHPDLYHETVKQRLDDFTEGLTPKTPEYKKAVTEALKSIAEEAQTPGKLINKLLTKS